MRVGELKKYLEDLDDNMDIIVQKNNQYDLGYFSVVKTRYNKVGIFPAIKKNTDSQFFEIEKEALLIK